MNKTIEGMYQRRQTWIEETKSLGFNLFGLLTDAYVDESHFVFELLQNAEDVGAVHCQIELREDCLVFVHNATRLFDLADIEGITSIGSSTKKAEVNKIGRFGVGIKSIFSLCDKFEIHSGGFHVCVQDFVVPHPLEGDFENSTRFVLWFKNPSAFDVIARRLKNLPEHLLLALNNIKILDVKISPNINVKRVCAERENGVVRVVTEKGEAHYLVFSEDDQALPCKVIYKLAKDMSKIEGVHVNKLLVFFETDKNLNLNFYVHAPFQTTPSRDTVHWARSSTRKFLQG